MKAAIILYANAISLLQQAGQLDRFIKTFKISFSSIELLLFYSGKKPEHFPDMLTPLLQIKLIKIEKPYSSEEFLIALEQIHIENVFNLFLFGSDGLGEELATRLSFRLNGSSCLQVEKCDLIEQIFYVEKPAYGNNLTATFKLEKKPYCLSIAKIPCSPLKMIKKDILVIELENKSKPITSKADQISFIHDPADTGLTRADFVIAIGQGVKNKENVNLLKRTASSIGARLGASRPVIMNAWIDIDRLIGSSGMILSPKILIAAGVSGAGAFCTGILNSDFIVAINTDSKAPIFQVADIGIVDDQMDILIALEKIINTEKSKEIAEK